MASITFFLKAPKQAAPTPIIARVSVAGRKVKVYTGLLIEPRKWIQAAQLVQTRGNAQAGTLNATLTAQRARLEAYLLDALAAGLVPTPEQLRQVLEPETVAVPVLASTAVEPAPPSGGLEPGPAEAVLPLLAAATMASDEDAEAEAAFRVELVVPGLLTAYETWDRAQADRLSPRTRQSNATTLGHLRAFHAATGYPVDFEHLTPVFATRFTAYLLATPKLTDNSVAKVLTRLKAFLRDAQLLGLVPPQEFRFLNWKRREPGIVTLTLEELARLERVDFVDQPGQRNARDLFLLACYTGLRYSDLAALRPEHWQGSLLRLRAQKTRETVTVPLRPGAQALLERLFAGELELVSNQKLNGHLKSIGRKAGLFNWVERVRYAGGQRRAERLRKFELLTCHTARRTFVTLALEQGIRPETVMKVTGHKSWNTFKRYVNISDRTIEHEFGAVYGGAGARR
ncbi:tyrosine-type recombinase/integrase [Hymenobacter sp. ASUV-10]|uniref:Tyrosine-type recombinase/integrase n=1 Tax=Hymenobacter aranciens TaxID=3063996 RepID=A0ABT9BCD2_9BACT|nr:site-specific integrase [Hymenobacter sp. ASUV-10]MDO7874361.1 tyrosine-type recombinase/integrase [Hymenobacter sp. ASUV-10]